MPKFSSISLGQQKFTPEDLIVETIANSEKARRSLARSSSLLGMPPCH
jgi:hypothetical protein